MTTPNNTFSRFRAAAIASSPLAALTLLSLSGCSLLSSGGTKTVPLSSEAHAAIPAPSLPKVALSAPLIIPRPKKERVPDKAAPFRITESTRIVVPDTATPQDLRAAAVLRGEIAARYGLTLPQVQASGVSALENVIVIGGAVANPLVVQQQAAGTVPAAPSHPEGYTVAVLPQAVVIAGRDAAGALWGAQTVVQMMADDNPVIWPAVIEDWPTLSMRAAHLFHGHNALPFHVKLIGRILSRYKMNALFLQAEQVRWDHDVDTAPGWGGTRAQLKEEIAYAHDHGMTVYPLLESYGHLQWRLDQGDRRELAEDPATPYAINFSDPKAVAYLDGFNAEADALFNAPGFHVGMDEVSMRGRYPFRSKPQAGPELFGHAANHWRNFFAARGKQVFLWGDMGLCATDAAPDFGSAHSPGEAAAVRNALPKDVTIVNWQYGERDDFPSLLQFKKAGFNRQIGATWYRPLNIQLFTRAATKIGAQGMIQTTWAGYESSEEALQKERKQFTAMVLAADYFWNGGEGPAPRDLPYDPERVFKHEWERTVRTAAAAAPPKVAVQTAQR